MTPFEVKKEMERRKMVWGAFNHYFSFPLETP
jgi:hypothetical protein